MASIEIAGDDVYEVLDEFAFGRNLTPGQQPLLPQLSYVHGEWVDKTKLNPSNVLIVFTEKASKQGGMQVPCKVSKAPPLMNAVAGRDYVFVVTIGSDVWYTFDEDQKRATLFRACCHFTFDHDEESGEVKYGIKPFDVQYHRPELDQFGAWLPDSLWATGEEDNAGDVTGTSKDPDVLEATLGIHPAQPI